MAAAGATAAKVELDEFAEECRQFAADTKENAKTASAAAKVHAKATLAKIEATLASLAAAAKQKGGEIADAVRGERGPGRWDWMARPLALAAA